MNSRLHAKKGFTLLEVMIALAIMALSVTTLIVIRNDTVKMAARTIDIRRMRILGEQKAAEIVAGIERKTSGNFREEGYEEHNWTAKIGEMQVPLPGEKQKDKSENVKLKQIELIIYSGDKLREDNYLRIITHKLSEPPEKDAKKKK